MWKINKREILDKYNLLLHPLRYKKILFDGIEYQILTVFKRWASGWYLSIEINFDEKKYIELPFKNINSDDISILERIDCVQERTKIIGGK